MTSCDAPTHQFTVTETQSKQGVKVDPGGREVKAMGSCARWHQPPFGQSIIDNPNYHTVIFWTTPNVHSLFVFCTWRPLRNVPSTYHTKYCSIIYHVGVYYTRNMSAGIVVFFYFTNPVNSLQGVWWFISVRLQCKIVLWFVGWMWYSVNMPRFCV